MGDKGLPWGPMQAGRPEDFEIATDPSQFKGFDTSPISARLNEELALQGGNQQRQALAGMSKAYGSGTTSGSMGGKLGNIAAQTAKNQGDISTQLAQLQWQDQRSMMDAFNRARQAKRNADMGIYQTEEGDRGSAVAGLMNGATSLASTAMTAGAARGAGAAARAIR